MNMEFQHPLYSSYNALCLAYKEKRTVLDGRRLDHKGKSKILAQIVRERHSLSRVFSALQVHGILVSRKISKWHTRFQMCEYFIFF